MQQTALATRPADGFMPGLGGIRTPNLMKILLSMLLMPVFLTLAGCSPTVKMQAPDKPIEITMNVNINHEIRVKVDKDIDDLVESKPGLF